MTVTSLIGTDPPSYKVGDLVNIVYDPNSPSEAKIDKIIHTHLESLISGAMGVLTLVIGLVFSLFF